MIYSYVIRSDSGFAPNPFWGVCTLACCKPKIRKTANVGDYIIGTGSKKNVGQNKLIYAMKVTEKLPWNEYSKKYRKKIPNDKTPKGKVGDNIYIFEHGTPKIRQNLKVRPLHKEKHIKKDVRNGKNVLISSHFIYFGKEAIKIPEKFYVIISGRGHKSTSLKNISPKVIKWIEELIKKYGKGIKGSPYNLKIGPDEDLFRKCRR